MNYIKEALSLGFTNAAVVDVKDLHFVPEYRQFCEENLCGCYNKIPACPPECGTPKEMKDRACAYKKALVLQTILLHPENSPAVFKKAKYDLNVLTEKLAEKIQADQTQDILIMSAGPYKQHSCMSAYGLDAQKMAETAGMVCWAGDSDVRADQTQDILIMSAGPYKQHSCMSAYGLDAQKMAETAGMVCWAGDSDVRFFSLILFH